MKIETNEGRARRTTVDTKKAINKKFVELDVAGMTRDQVKDLAATVKCRLIRWEASGPGGGNPTAHVECPSFQAANKLVTAIYGTKCEKLSVYLV